MIILGIIPARFASTRFPGKPLVDINGKPMIQRVYEQALKALPYVCVATDDERIEKAVKLFGGEVVMTANTHESGTDRCAEAVIIYEKSKNINADVVINIQGDEPFIDPGQIKQLIELFELRNASIATLIKKVSESRKLQNPNVVKVVTDKNNDALYFSRTCIPYLRNNQPVDTWMEYHDFYQHVGMYGYRKDILHEICNLPKGTLETAESLEQLRWLEHGYKIKTAETKIESIGIDTPEDLESVKSIFKNT